ncbi:Uncharacterized protein M6B38_225855 [Iris pallida]|uniref:RING-CH-type domain-containing protein n=1 Tax=Iris pallida TaxID=29817 RepID=A0AAX6DV72_IRIPA|nr:Uncharacterized protein M6B38_225855 [Iris pallida]
MEFGDIEENGTQSSSSSSSYVMCLCRICHEEEEEKSTTMESPCSCSGTLKFAHRECIQRWCNEKGSAVCEICLQKFEPGYTVPVKLALIDIAVTIRGSLEVPRLNYESRNQGGVDDESDDDYPDCSPASDRGVGICRSVAVIVTLILLARHFFVVVTTDAGHYPYTLATVFMLRACGILLPLYLVLRLIAAYQKGRLQHERYERDVSPIPRAQGEEHEQVAHLTIQIHS